MPDAPSHAASLTVLGGPLKGKQLLIEDAVDEILIGSDPDSRLYLDLPGVSPIHARIWLDLAGATVYDTRSPRGVYINDARVSGEAPLRDGDVLWLGPPGEPESVMIQFRGPGEASALSPATGAKAASRPERPAAAAEPDFALEPPPAPARPSPAASEGEPLAGLLDDFAFLEEPTVSRSAPEPPSAPSLPPAAPPPPAMDEFRASAMPDEFLVETPDPAEATWAPAGGEPSPAAGDVFFVEEPPAAPAASAPATQVGTPPPAPPPVTTPPAAPSPVAARAATAASPPPSPVAAGPAAPEPAKPGAPSGAKAEAPPPRRLDRPAPAPARPSAPLRRPRPERPAMERPGERPRRPAAGRPIARYAVLGALLVAVLAAGGFFLMRQFSAPSIQSIAPSRVRAGEVVAVEGRNFASEPSGNVVRFEGTREGRIVRASPTQLQVEVPDVPAAVGRPNRVPVTVTVGGRTSDAFLIAVYQAPRIHGLSPSVAMPGEEIVLAGTGWGPGVAVRFGTVDVPVVDVTSSSIKVRVPPLNGPPGTSVPVVVSMGADPSNPAPFILGRLPLILSFDPRSAGAGDAVTIEGRGFDRDPARDQVRIGGTRALVASSSEEQLKVAVPFLAAPAGEAPVEVRVSGLDNPAQAALTLSAPSDPVDLRFAAEPFEDEAGHPHASLSTALGPAFVLSAAGGRTAAQRALEAQRRLNEAAAALKASREADVEVRSADGAYALFLTGKGDPLLEVRPEDAAAYNEDWTKLKGKGAAATPGRLASWWGAVLRDLALLLVRNEKPHYAAALAPEGRVLGDLFDVAHKSAGFGVPRSVIAEARPPVKAALRSLALRLPASVPGPAGEVAAAAPAPAGAPPLRLEGPWAGSVTEDGERKFVSVSFTPPTGTLTYERALSLTVSLTNLAQARDGSVRFEAQAGRGSHYYVGRWDGQKITGQIASDAAGKDVIGSFEFERR